MDIDLTSLFDIDILLVLKFLFTLPFVAALFCGFDRVITKLRFFYKLWLYFVMTVYFIIIIEIWMYGV